MSRKFNYAGGLTIKIFLGIGFNKIKITIDKCLFTFFDSIPLFFFQQQKHRRVFEIIQCKLFLRVIFLMCSYSVLEYAQRAFFQYYRYARCNRIYHYTLEYINKIRGIAYAILSILRYILLAAKHSG